MLVLLRQDPAFSLQVLLDVVLESLASYFAHNACTDVGSPEVCSRQGRQQASAELASASWLPLQGLCQRAAPWSGQLQHAAAAAAAAAAPAPAEGLAERQVSHPAPV